MSEIQQENPILGLLPAAEKTLGAALGATVRLEPGEVLDGREHVMRCTVVAERADAPATVIVKSAHNPRRGPYDPEAIEADSAAALFLKDWLGVQFLEMSRPEGTPRFSPRFYGGDRARGYFLMEDLGAGESLANLLLGEDAERAEAGLRTYARTLGRMHAATLRQNERFDALCTSLGIAPERIDAAIHRQGVDIEKWNRCCTELGVTPAPGTAEDIGAVQTVLTTPGSFLAYTHGDPCPDNNRLTADGMCLFDFEHGGFRHALVDGVYGRVPFPTCWCVNRLPDDLPARLEAEYRAELAPACPEAADADRFHRESLTLWGGWLLNTIQWGLEEVRNQDQTWGISSVRQRHILRTRLFADATVTAGYLTALGETMQGLGQRLEELWGADIEPMPLYPAFR